jgi:hypothetical protein
LEPPDGQETAMLLLYVSLVLIGALIVAIEMLEFWYGP